MQRRSHSVTLPIRTTDTFRESFLPITEAEDWEDQILDLYSNQDADEGSKTGCSTEETKVETSPPLRVKTHVSSWIDETVRYSVQQNDRSLGNDDLFRRSNYTAHDTDPGGAQEHVSGISQLPRLREVRGKSLS